MWTLTNGAIAAILGMTDTPAAPVFPWPAPPQGPAHGSFIATGDVDGDGVRDLIVDGPFQICVARGDGIGGWDIGVARGNSSIVRDLEISDLDVDGDLDIAITRGWQSFEFSLNTGNGTFTTPSWVPTHGPYVWVSQLELEDLDGDGRSDVIVAGNFAETFFNAGSGVFAFGQSYSLRGWSSSMKRGDFDADGLTDLAILFDKSGALTILRGSSAGSFSPQQPILGFDEPSALATGRLNADSFDDLLIGCRGDDAVWSYLGNGQLQFVKHTRLHAGGHPKWIDVGDIDNDDRLDVVTADMEPGKGVHVGLGDGNGGFSSTHSRSEPMQPTCVELGDFDGDARLDAVAGGVWNRGLTFLGGIAQPREPIAGSKSSTIGGPTLAALSADLDLDGDSDLVIVRDQPGQAAAVDTYLCDGAAGFVLQGSIPVLITFEPLARLIDYDGDGLPDLVFSGSKQIFVYRGTGTGFGVLPLLATPSSTYHELFAANIGGDPRVDIVALGTSSISWIINQGQVGPVVPTAFPFSLPPGYGVAVGNVDGDDRAELLIASGLKLHVLSFVGPVPVELAAVEISGFHDLWVFDLDADGWDDLVGTRYLSGQFITIIRRGLGGSSFEPERLIDTEGIGFASFADFDADGGLDIVRRAGASQIEVVRTNSAGFVRSVDRYHVAYLPLDQMYSPWSAVGDFDSDGRPDFVYARNNNVAESSLEIVLNQSRSTHSGGGLVIGAGCIGASGLAPTLSRKVGMVEGAIRHAYSVHGAPSGAVGILVIAALPTGVPAPTDCGSYLGVPTYFGAPFTVPSSYSALGEKTIAVDLHPGTAIPAHSAQAFLSELSNPGGWSATNALVVRDP